MDSTVENILVPLYFVHAAVGATVMALWFLNKKKQSLKDFGLGMAGYAVGLTIWTIAVITKPENLELWILLGVVPFLLAHVAYAKSAGEKLPAKSSSVITLTLILVFGTFIARTFFYNSEPYFSEKGLLYFGLQPVAVALYIATISVSFLPAIRTVVEDIKTKSIKSTLGTCLTVLYVNSIILVSASDDTLLLINGVVMSSALLVSWVTLAKNFSKS